MFKKSIMLSLALVSLSMNALLKKSAGKNKKQTKTEKSMNTNTEKIQSSSVTYPPYTIDWLRQHAR